MSAHAQPISFNSSGLQGDNLNNPTSLQFGPDGRLYVSQQNGVVYAYTVERDNAAPGSGTYTVTATEQITLVKNNTPNHNDDGVANGTNVRQVTGLLTAGTAANPILYATSSDWRIGGGGSGNDTNLDTNSGVLTRLTWNGSAWEKVDLVRGLPRCEENHSTNGMALVGNTLLVQSGGHTNKGAPSNNFAGTPEYFLSGVLLRIDLGQLNGMTIYTDPRSNTKYIYDLPTLNDPTRPDINNTHAAFPYPAGHPMYNATIDLGDPFGGNNSLNQAFAEPNGPVHVLSYGYRNAYDVLITEDGRVFTGDNGPNGGWGGKPVIRNSDGTYKGVQGQGGVVFDYGAGDYITNEFNESQSSTHGDGLHYVGMLGDADGAYYGGHPKAIQAFPGRAGIVVYSDASGSWQLDASYTLSSLLGGVAGYFQQSYTLADFPDRPAEGEYLADNAQPSKVNIIDLVNSSTNGLTEYTASNFGGNLQGDILTASFNGQINRYKIAANNTSASLKTVLFQGFGNTPLDVVAQGDHDVFPGTVWTATYGESSVTVFEPSDYGNCPQPGDADYVGTDDSDGDLYTNDDEVANGTNPCSAGSKPRDNDNDNLSDLLDADDDNDGILDVNDAFAIDAANGLGTNLPINYSFFNNDPGTFFFGLGFSGLMMNGTTDYLNQFDEANISAGGAAGKMAFDLVSSGDAAGAGNNQENAFQLGINVDANSIPFTFRSEVESPFFLVGGNASIPVSFQSQGVYIGTGDQDNYLKVVFSTGTSDTDAAYGMDVCLEEQGVISCVSYDVPDITAAAGVEIFISVDPGANTAGSFVSLDGGATVTQLGSALTLPACFLDAADSRGLAIGLIATSRGTGPEFGASWDFFSVEENQSGQLVVGPTPLDFGVVPTDAPPLSLNLGAINQGSPTDGPITITSLTVTGPDAALFTTGTGTPLSVGVSSTLILPVVFTADSDPGVKTATLEIVHSGANTPILVPLTTTVATDQVPLVRINAGGAEVTATDGGPNWEANSNLNPGPSFSVISDGNNTYSQAVSAAQRHASIPAYVDDATYEAIFLQERWDDILNPVMEYFIPLADGDYTVNLYLANGWQGASTVGTRLFSIDIEESVVETDFDIIAVFGHLVGGMLQHQVTVSDGTLNIKFLHGPIENPLINAIEILGTPVVMIPPVVVAPLLDRINVEGDFVTNLTVSAAGGDPQENFTYAISGQPQGVTIEPTNGQIFGTIAPGTAAGGPSNDGVYTTSVTVTKPGSAAQVTTFGWTVTTNPQIPVTLWTDQTDDENYTDRHECSFVQAGDNFFLFGGRENSSTLDVYDYQSKTWSQGRADAPKAFNHFQAVEYDGLIWVIAAFQNNSFPNEMPAEFIWSYDPANDEWIQGPAIPAARRRGSAGLALHNDKFYVVGGNTIGHNGGYVNWFDVYDPADGSWTVLTDAPRQRDHFHVDIIDNKLYVAGGRLSGGPGGTFAPLIAEVDVYDFATASWSSLPAAQNLPTPRASASAAAFNNKLFVIGGEIGKDLSGNNINDAQSVTESYDPTTQTWSTEDDLIQKRHGTQAIVSGGGIHVAAGSPQQGGGSIKKMEFYGTDNPQGATSIAGVLSTPAQVPFTAGVTQTITLSHTAGNVGIPLRGFTITGTNATDFQIVAGDLASGFLKTGSTHQLQVQYTGTSNTSASLTVTYGANSTRQIQLISSGFYSITATAGADGSISPAGIVSVAAGGNQTYAITADPGHQVADVLVNGTSVGAITAYTFTNIQSDATITATFSPIVAVNLPPVIAAISDRQSAAGGTISTQIQVTDEATPNVTLVIYDI
ncbi:MAG: malectin domain-containing carbohydrate-binding protein, partial [Saprospiraceae bacterium]